MSLKEAIFWKRTAWGLVLLLVACVYSEWLAVYDVPGQFKGLLIGGLICIVVGRGVLTPQTYVHDGSEEERKKAEREEKFNKVAVPVFLLFMSGYLGVMLFFTDKLSDPARWIVMPIILLMPFLGVRAIVVKVRDKKKRPSAIKW